MSLSKKEIREVTQLIEKGELLPEKYRTMLFEESAFDVSENNEKNIDFAYLLMVQKLGFARDAFNGLESKIGIFLGFVGVIAGSVIVLVKENPHLFGLNIFTLGVVGLLLTLVALTVASQPRSYLDPPDFSSFYTRPGLAQNNVDYKNQALADMKASYEHNYGIQQLKAKLFNFAIYCFLLSIVLLFLGIIEK